MAGIQVLGISYLDIILDSRHSCCYQSETPFKNVEICPTQVAQLVKSQQMHQEVNGLIPGHTPGFRVQAPVRGMQEATDQ